MTLLKQRFNLNYLLLFSLCVGSTLGFPQREIFGQAEEEGPQGVVIERAALTLISPSKFQVPLQVQPVKVLPVVAPMDGEVRDLFVKPGDSVKDQMELIRLDSQVFNLQLKRAQAVYEVARIALAQAKNEDDKKLLDAKLKVAKGELDLAQFHVDQTIQRTSLTGLVTELHVTKGQFVRAGDLLAVVVDPTELYTEVPAERSSIEVGKTVKLTIEDKEADAKVDTVLPPLEKFDPLRELFVSVATARLIIDAKDGQIAPGQSVHSPMIPKHPVAEIQIAALKTDTENPDAERMVQVIRDGFVRTLPVQVLGQVGQTHIFVSSRFAEGDELIISTSEELPDGSWVRPMLLEAPPEMAPRNTRPPARSPFGQATNPENDKIRNQFQRSPILPDTD